MASFDLELFNFRLTKLLLLLIVEVVDLLCCVGVGWDVHRIYQPMLF